MNKKLLFSSLIKNRESKIIEIVNKKTNTILVSRTEKSNSTFNISL